MKAGFSHESQRAQTVEWFTPPWLFTAMGLRFDLDPCAPPGGLPWIPADRFLCEADNGLAQPWQGRVWCNPPYGAMTAPFMRKMHEHRNGVALVFARTDTEWFHAYAAKADAILFLQGRLAFVPSGQTEGRSGAGAGSILVAWGQECADALERVQKVRTGLLHRGF